MAKQPDHPSQPTPFRTTIGGQALIEGILMRGPEKQAIVVRKPDGDLVTKVEELHLIKERHPILGVPLIRGTVNFLDSMVKGVQALMFSAEFYPEDEEEAAEPSKFEVWLEKKLGSEQFMKVLIALAVVLAAVAGGTYMAELWGGKTIPEVVGLSQPEAVDALAAKGFVAQAVEVKSDDPQGTVLSSDPEQGHRAEEGSTVTLSVAVPRIVPAIVGATSEEAAQALEAEGFTAVTYTEEKSNEAAGTVLAVSPEAGTEAKSGDAITVTVAVPYTVPDVEGMSEADAKAALQAEGYEVTSEWYTTEDIEEGTAVSTDPAAGSELNSGSEVTLYVAHSRGTELVDLTREILPGANLTNDEGSFKVENIKSCTYRGDGEVLYTVEARQYEVVTMPFGLGQETVFAKKLTTIEGGIVWNDDNEVSYASPSIRY